MTTYAFWFPVDHEQHASDLCALHGMQLRLVRKIPQMMKPAGRPSSFGSKHHVRPDILQCRALKQCSLEEAKVLHETLGYRDVMPEEVGSLLG